MNENLILLITIALLIFTYWILIWRLNKLIGTIKNFDSKIKSAESSLHASAKYMQGLYAQIMRILGSGTINDGKVHISGSLERFGNVDLDLELKNARDKDK